MGSSRQTQTQNQTRNPYAPSQPLLQDQANAVSAYTHNPNSSAVYGGPRVAQMTDTTRGGLDQLGAAQGANASSGYYNDVLNGKYLNGNPAQADMDRNITNQTMAQLNGQFSNAGLVGSTLNQQAVSQGLTSGLAASHYGNYQNERGQMGQAAGALPSVDAQGAQQRIAAGQGQEGYTQNNYNNDQQVYNEQRDASLRPYLASQGLTSGIAGAGGTASGTATTSQNPSMGQQLLGGAMMGGSLLGGGMGGMFGGGMFGGGMNYNQPRTPVGY